MNYGENEAIIADFFSSTGYEVKTMHIHAFYEIYMAAVENVRFFVNDSVCLLKKGDVALFNSYDLHKVSVDDDALYERWVITFPLKLLSNQVRDWKNLLTCFDDTDHRIIRLTPAEQKEFTGFAEYIRSQKADDPFSDAAKAFGLSQILILLCRKKQDFIPHTEPVIDKSSSYTYKIQHYVDENFRENITLDDISELCFLNKSYLCRVFKQETGFCIHDYITYRRLSNAIELLRRGTSVSEAARLSGFSSDTFFITVFRQNIGMTPYQYAKRYRNAE